MTEVEIRTYNPPLKYVYKTNNQQQNKLVIQEQQEEIQCQREVLPEIQTQQYHPPIQQIHHSMVFDHRTGMLVMALKIHPFIVISHILCLDTLLQLLPVQLTV